MNANPLRRLRLPATAAALLMGLASAGCENLLDVTNPSYISEDQLTDPALEQLVVNGVLGEFQYSYGYYALYSAALFALTEGRAYSAAEYQSWIRTTGLTTIGNDPTGVHCRVITAMRQE